MEARIKIPLTAFDWSVEVMAILVLLFLWVLALYSYFFLQDIIPIHFDAAGRVTKWGEKTTLLFFPLTATVIYAGLTIISRYPRFLNTIDWQSPNVFMQVRYSMRTIRVLKVSIALAFTMVVAFTHLVLNGQPSPLGPWLLPAMLLVLLGPVVYFVYRLIAHYS